MKTFAIGIGLGLLISSGLSLAGVTTETGLGILSHIGAGVMGMLLSINVFGLE